MKTKEEILFEMRITDMILKVANAYEDVPTTDLQGMAQATAGDIIRIVREAKQKEGYDINKSPANEILKSMGVSFPALEKACDLKRKEAKQ